MLFPNQITINNVVFSVFGDVKDRSLEPCGTLFDMGGRIA